jgi:hypothetical protein
MAIAICDRCRMKRYYDDLTTDPNTVTLRVCRNTCVDEYDPYRLAARQPESINLQFPRPDADISTTSGSTTSSYTWSYVGGSTS